MRADDRSGIGLALGIVLWVLALAFLYAMVQSQARGGATGSMIRAAHLRSMVFAGQSALEEASFAWRHQIKEPAAALQEILKGSRSGTAHQPTISRTTFAAAPGLGTIHVGTVTYAVVSAPAGPTSTAPLQIDLEVQVETTLQRTRLTRSVRRRHLGWIHRVVQTAGPANTIGRVLLSEVSIDRAPLFETITP